MMQFLGLSSLVALLPVLAFALALISGREFNRIRGEEGLKEAIAWRDARYR